MKKLSVLLVVLSSISFYCQTWMQIQKVDGGKDSVELANISKIYFTTTPTVFICGASTIEYSGRTYNTVQIGTQCWMRENLDVGTRINGNLEQTDNSTIEKYCYDDNTANCNAYGGLYQWNEAMGYITGPGLKGICPTGWHIPTLAEFEVLKAEVNDDGNALKAVGQGSGYGAGTNTSGFSALLAGYRFYDGYFDYLGYYAYFWSSTEDDATFAYSMALATNDSGVYMSGGYKRYGFSIRCLKDY